MGITEVTNAQYEKFDPSHKELRGKYGLSNDDDEAVVFISYNDAVNFCKWLSKKENKTYRLPTEAEWEYACRAGTKTKYNTGNSLPEEFHKNAKRNTRAVPVPLHVAKTTQNKWGLFDMHGNVEEWCHDWYAPYKKGTKKDPVGAIDGDSRVTRGGSHSTKIIYLRSANRSGAMPDTRNWLIGFRVVVAPLPKTEPAKLPPMPDFLKNIKQNIPADIAIGPDPDKPYFRGPRQYVTIPKHSDGPLYSKHNHDPAITECPNGDLLAIWYTTEAEADRNLNVAASRLRYGSDKWDPAYLFWAVPDRNDHAPSMWTDEKGKLYHFNGQAGTGGWEYLIVIMRTSTDNGATWSKAKIILPEYTRNHQPIESTFRLSTGEILLPSDDRGGTSLWLSKDEGISWYKPKGKIRGIHAGIVQLSDNSIFAFGRGRDMNNRVATSISKDYGETWEYYASEFQPLGGGLRPALIKLHDGSIFFATFTKRVPIKDASGKIRKVNGLLGALSVDDGKTWQYKRLITDDKPARDIGTMDNHPIIMSPYSAEPVGYLAVCQSPDGIIHLISSIHHYAFNKKWLMTPPPVAKEPQQLKPKKLRVKRKLAKTYEPAVLPSEHNWKWNCNAKKIKEENAVSFLTKGIINLTTGPNQQIWFRSEEPEIFGKVKYKKGYTAEIKTQIIKTTDGERGIDLEIYNGVGARHVMTITEDAIWWFNGVKTGSGFISFDQYIPLAQNLDNTDTMHTYRIAVRPDRVAQIYRDNELIGTRLYEYRTPRGPYIYFGAGEGVQALIDYVAFDLKGAFQPTKK